MSYDNTSLCWKLQHFNFGQPCSELVNITMHCVQRCCVQGYHWTQIIVSTTLSTWSDWLRCTRKVDQSSGKSFYDITQVSAKLTHAKCTLRVHSAMCAKKCSDLIVQRPKVLCSNALCSKVLCSKVQPICQTRPNNKGLCRLSQPPSCCSGGKRGDGWGGYRYTIT